MGWLEDVRNLPPERRAVLHRPETPRYSRARSKLPYLLRASNFLGEQPDPEREFVLLIALWAPPESGRGHGFYSCLRLFFEGETVGVAVLYTFYDGTERSPGFRSLEAATAYAEANGFVRAV